MGRIALTSGSKPKDRHSGLGPESRRFSICTLIALWILSTGLWAQPLSKVYLNGIPSPVYFNDGDTFKVIDGPFKGMRARLAGFNTLESYGPVHQWGDWSKKELYHFAKIATVHSRQGVWHCTSEMKKDRYGRALWQCPDLAEDLIANGLAHAMTVTKSPSPESLLEVQREAIKNKVGMWARGVPEYILTSSHSTSENAFGEQMYDRFVSTKDGHSIKYIHSNRYKECESVCYDPTEQNGEPSCLVYVHYRRRYGREKAHCLT